MSDPLAYFITITCFGTWLHGDERGSVDRDHNIFGTPQLPHDPERLARGRELLRGPAYTLDVARRQVTLRAIREIAERKHWPLHAAHVRSNHIHVVVSAGATPERVMNDLKTAASRRLNQAFPDERGRPRWARHGSTRYLWSEDEVAYKVDYVLNGQGEPMDRYPAPSL